MEARGLRVVREKCKKANFSIILVHMQKRHIPESIKNLTEDELRTILAENYKESEAQIEERIRRANSERHLDDIGDNMSQLILRAWQNFNIYKLVGENASAIKQKHRSPFLGYVQRESLDALCLNICKIYEEPIGRYF